MDLNADVGEGFLHDRALLGLISSANIACGFHAGDEATMRQLCCWCAESGVTVGAQVSYRDREGFGRRRVEIGYDDLRADIMEQIDALRLAAGTAGVTVAYVKPHGALYNRVVSDPVQARAVVDAAERHELAVLGLPGSDFLSQAADRGLRVAREFFADRSYTAAGRLVARSDAGALVTDPSRVAARVAELVMTGCVTAFDGSSFTVEADSICVHGDTDGAVALATVVAATLSERAVELRPFA